MIRLGLTASMSAALEETRRACCLLDRQMDDMRQTVSEGQVGGGVRAGRAGLAGPGVELRPPWHQVLSRL